MKTRGWKIENGGWSAQSALDCGSPLPLFLQQPAGARQYKSARRLAQSKTWRTFVVQLGFLVLASSFCLTTLGQTYTIDWYKISGGGGTSTGGTYTVSGTIGQPDAGAAMSGGNYSITGGFWSLISVVQTAGLPNLLISHAGNSVIVSWPNTGSYTLQQCSNLAGASWTTSGYTVTTANGTNSITVTPLTGNLFFRLQQP